MRVLITGGAGFLGRRLAHALLARGTVAGVPIARLVLADIVPCRDEALLADARVRTEVGDLRERLPALLAQPVDAVFHLASAVSGECEADFDLGLRANLDTTRALLDALRAQQAAGGPAARLVFASSVAVFGSEPAAPLPAVVDDHTLPLPQSSYGIQKFVCEQLVADWTRKGFIQGRSARLMTVSVRPGAPNGAASGFLSGVIREPLAGKASNCPVSPDTRVALSSPARAVEGLLAVMDADTGALGGRSAVNLPALSVTVGEMLAALEDVAGPEARALVSMQPDASVQRIVGGWPGAFTPARARALGLNPDGGFRDIVLQYVRDNPQAVTNAQALRAAGMEAPSAASATG